jgi:hypothetical protein
MVLYISGWRETRYPQVNNYVELKAKNLAPTAAGTRSLHILDKSTFREKWRAQLFCGTWSSLITAGRHRLRQPPPLVVLLFPEKPCRPQVVKFDSPIDDAHSCGMRGNEVYVLLSDAQAL